MFRHGASQTGLSESVAPTTPVIQLRNYTVANYPNYPSIVSTPVISGGFMYVASRDSAQEIYGVSCIKTSTGGVVWNFQKESVPFNTPAVSGGRVYVGSGSSMIKTEGNVYCLDALSGALVWNSSVNEPVCSPVNLADGRVFFESTEGNLFCLDAATGNKMWNYSMGGKAGWGLCPAVADGYVFASNNDDSWMHYSVPKLGIILCLNAADGTAIWNFTVSNYVSSPAIAHGNVYFGSADGNAYCLNASTGHKVWNYTTWFNSGGPAHNYQWGNTVGSPALGYGYVFVGSSDFDAFCLDALTGEKVWNLSIDAASSFPPAIANGCVYISSYSGTIHCLNASSGSEYWNYSAGSFSPINSGIDAPVIADGEVYVRTLQDLYGSGFPEQGVVVALGMPHGVLGFSLVWVAAGVGAFVAVIVVVYLKKNRTSDASEVKNP